MGDDGRYSRHYSLPGVGESGQKKLAEARVLVIGAGALEVQCFSILQPQVSGV